MIWYMIYPTRVNPSSPQLFFMECRDQWSNCRRTWNQLSHAILAIWFRSLFSRWNTRKCSLDYTVTFISSIEIKILLWKWLMSIQVVIDNDFIWLHLVWLLWCQTAHDVHLSFVCDAHLLSSDCNPDRFTYPGHENSSVCHFPYSDTFCVACESQHQ